MVIINGNTFNTKGREELEDVKKYLYETLNKLSCPNKCKKDMLIHLSYHEKKDSVISDIYGPCCSYFEKDIKPYLRPFLK